MRDRAHRSSSAHLLGALVALLLALGPGGASHGTAAPGEHAVVAVAGVQGTQAVLDLHGVPRLAGNPGNAATAPVALGVVLLPARWRRSSRARASAAAFGRPVRGSRAPPRPSTSA
jgi:hypothetical protein